MNSNSTQVAAAVLPPSTFSHFHRIPAGLLCSMMIYFDCHDLQQLTKTSRCLHQAVDTFLVLLSKETLFVIPVISLQDMLHTSRYRYVMDMLHVLSLRKIGGTTTTTVTKVVLELARGVHEITETWTTPAGITHEQTLAFPWNNISIVGKGEAETTILGGLAAENGKHLTVTNLTINNSSGFGLFGDGFGTTMKLNHVTLKECQFTGICVRDGAKLVANNCTFAFNGGHGVWLDACGHSVVGPLQYNGDHRMLWINGHPTTARLTNCKSHHNKHAGVRAYKGAVVDLMGERTSVHDNERNGLWSSQPESSINVYQPCILDQMSFRNGGENIKMAHDGTVQQKYM